MWSLEALDQEWQHGSKLALGLALFGLNKIFFQFELGARNVML